MNEMHPSPRMPGSAALGTVTAGERIVALDVLRGIALLGVVMRIRDPLPAATVTTAPSSPGGVE